MEEKNKRRPVSPVRRPVKGRATQSKGQVRPSREEARREVGRRHKRRRKSSKILYYIMMVFFVLTIGITLSLTVFFRIEHISVEGTSPYENNQIIEKTGIKVGSNLFLAKADSYTELLIEKAFPYIEKAKITRKIPSGIVVKVTEAQKYAAFRTDKGFAVISTTGKLLEMADAMPEGVTEVSGLTASSYTPGTKITFENKEVEQLFFDLTKTLKNNNLNNITAIDLSDPLKISLVYQNRIKLLVGTSVDLDHKIGSAKRTIESEIGENETGLLDLNIVGKIIFRPQEINSSVVQEESSASDSSQKQG